MLDWLKVLLMPVENPTVTNSIVAIMLAISTGIFFGRLKLGKMDQAQNLGTRQKFGLI